MPDTAFTFAPIGSEDAEAASVVSHVFRVAPENVTPLWQQVSPLVERALHGHATHQPEDVRKMLLGSQAQLWVQWADRVDAVTVTEFIAYPRGVWVRIWLAGARPDVRFDDAAFLASLSMWRDMHACKGFEAIGRLGWLRRIPGARFIGAVMRSEPT